MPILNQFGNFSGIHNCKLYVKLKILPNVLVKEDEKSHFKVRQSQLWTWWGSTNLKVGHDETYDYHIFNEIHI